MLVKLLKDAKVKHHAGEIVEVSPDEFVFLTSTRCAIAAPKEKPEEEQPAEEQPAKATKGSRKK